MRNIKFRAWHRSRKKYVDVVGISFDNDTVTEIQYHDLGSAHEQRRYAGVGIIELEQATGLKDSYGKEIYDGDIVEWSRIGMRPSDYDHDQGKKDVVLMCRVYWDEQACGFMVEWKFPTGGGGSTSLGGLLKCDRADSVKLVIEGNIHEAHDDRISG